MSRNRKRAKTAMVAFPVVGGTGSPDQKSTIFVDYPILHRRTSVLQSEKEMNYATLPSNTKIVQGIYQRNTRMNSCIAKSTSNLFSLPPPPPLNPKLRFLKTLLNSKATNTNLKLKTDNEPAENFMLREPLIPAAAPTLPPKLRTIKTPNTKVLSSPQIGRKAVPHKTRAEAGIKDNALEVLLPSLQSCPAPGSQNIKGSQNDDNAAIFSDHQFHRSQEERDESPESLHLDKKGFKHFPLLGSDESSLKLLSLQHNLICRLENLPSLNHLLVLDLYNNRVERMTGLQVFYSLRVLLLGKNRIRRIEGLDGLKRLEILDLHGNQLRYVDNLASLTSLRVLNLAGNSIRSIRNLGPYGLSALTELNLKRNRIKNLDGLQKAPHIRKLLLANNELQSLSALHPLRKMQYLQELLLESNPICSLSEFTSQILTLFPWITTLDKVMVTDQMKLEAKAWHRRRIAQDEEIRKEQEKLRLTVASTREEVIHEARRRWESVKNFVKHSSNTDENPDQDSSSRPQIEFPIDLRRSKSETRSKDAAEEMKQLTQSRFPCYPSTPNITEAIPLPRLTEKRGFLSRNDSVITTLTKSISLNPIAHSGLPSSSPEKNQPRSSQERLSCDEKAESVGFPLIETEPTVLDAHSPEPSAIKKLMKVAVVRPLVRVPRPPQPSFENLIGALRISPTRQDFQINNQSCEERVSLDTHDPNLTRFAESEGQNDLFPTVSISPIIDFQIDSVSGQNEFAQASNNLKSATLADKQQTNAPEQMHTGQFPAAVELSVSNTSTEFLQNVHPELDPIAPASPASPALGKRPVFGRSNTVSILSSVPTSLATNNANSSSGSSSATSSNMNISGIKPNEVECVEKYLLGDSSSPRIKHASMKTRVNSLRSNSVDAQLVTSDSDTFDVESVSTSVSATAVTSDAGSRRTSRSLFPRRGRLKRGQTARAQSSASASISLRRPVTGIRDRHVGGMSPLGSGRSTKRRVSATPAAIESPTSNIVKKQGIDFLVEIDGKVLSLYGQGALKHMLTGFTPTLIANVNTVKFHFITFDAIIPHFGKLRQTYPALQHVQFRANNITMLAQLNALADLQGLCSLQISKEGNPIVENEVWQHYAIYRLAHWGLQQINGKEIPSEYRGGAVPEDCKVFESLGYLALSCLPQSALTPLAKKLHTLHCFCCCSPSTSSDESGRRKVDANGDGESSGTICTSWDDDPVLLDVIGKEALVYMPSKDENTKSKELPREVGGRIVSTGRDMIDKLDLLENTWPSLMTEVVEDILIDYLCMDNYMKKELRKLKDLSMATNNRKSKF